MVGDLSTRRLLHLFSDVYQGLSVFKGEHLDVVPCTSQHIPWDVAFYLTSHNRKHRECSARLPSVRKVSMAINSFDNKLKWNTYFQDRRSDQKYLKFVKNIPIAQFPKHDANFISPPELSAWLHLFREQILLLCDANRARSRGQWWKNICLIDKIAIRFIRQQQADANGLIPIPADKAGAIVLVRRSDLFAQHSAILSKSCYVEVPLIEASDQFYNTFIAKEYVSLCEKVAKFEKDAALSTGNQFVLSARHLTVSASRRAKGIRARLQNTVKSHKGAWCGSYETNSRFEPLVI